MTYVPWYWMAIETAVFVVLAILAAVGRGQTRVRALIGALTNPDAAKDELQRRLRYDNRAAVEDMLRRHQRWYSW